MCVKEGVCVGGGGGGEWEDRGFYEWNPGSRGG